MRSRDRLAFAFTALGANRLRTALILLAMATGVAAVIVLAALGESARRYVTGEFASLGTNLLIVLPGRIETTGGPPPGLGETPRDLTLDDMEALARSARVGRIAPLVVGSAPASYGDREREITVLGSTAAFAPVRHLRVAQGEFLPAIDAGQAASVCVLGTDTALELFGTANPLGQWLRIGDRRFRVVGILARTGVSIGADIDETIVIPVASAQALFNQSSLFRIMLEARYAAGLDAAKADVERILTERHEGELDVTVITQDSVVATFDKILRALTYGVTAIAAVSLVVAGILIMNVMLVAVSQRTEEIGLLQAIGAERRLIERLFLLEALALSACGGCAGVGIGIGAALLLARLYPLLPIAPPPWALAAAFAIALASGLVFGVLPARRAARLDPVDALARR
jgi:putative ABC transport system permease protein